MATLHARAVFTHCLSLHTGASVYGGVTRWLLAPGRLELETIEFDAQHVADLEEWLPKVLERTRSSGQTRPTRAAP